MPIQKPPDLSVHRDCDTSQDEISGQVIENEVPMYEEIQEEEKPIPIWWQKEAVERVFPW